MRKRELDFFRKLLTRRLEELLMEAERAKYQVKETDQPSSDPMELASNEFDRDFLLRLRDRERKLMIKIKAALERIEDGTFGTCEECGDKISEKRLHARPMATLCIECKHEQEASEKRIEYEESRERPRLWAHM
ncbi:MAG: RNA polymerase-binding protein DksA [Proteobacteria bacterium]|nr:RNA polymerase-binding protein DksA [Pseudomonadota bacterium]